MSRLWGGSMPPRVLSEYHFRLFCLTLIASGLLSPPTYGQDQPTTQQQIAQLTQQQQLLSLQLQLLQTQASILGAQRALSADASQTGDITQQVALLNALTSLQTAQSNLAKSDIDAETALASSKKALVDAQNQLQAAQLKSNFVGADVLKQYFSAPSKEGSVTIKDTGARLLRTSVASAEATNELAHQL